MKVVNIFRWQSYRNLWSEENDFFFACYSLCYSNKLKKYFIFCSLEVLVRRCCWLWPMWNCCCCCCLPPKMDLILDRGRAECPKENWRKKYVIHRPFQCYAMRTRESWHSIQHYLHILTWLLGDENKYKIDILYCF